jgi:ABC-2 type transport system ATP-binding protein
VLYSALSHTVETSQPIAPNSLAAAPVLVVENLSKSYEGRPAVDQLSFSIDSGAILGLVGPNGAGKTTTLRSIVGILPVTQGRIVICGYDVERHEAQAKSCLCWVPDDPEPFDALTVHEHLEFTAALYSVPHWRERAEELLERFELTEKRDALGGELSRGMRQKLAFCCAWLPRPRLVLLDEPLSGLDPRGIRSAKHAILELAREGTAVILSSHLLALIEELATRLLILDRGLKIFEGTLGEARTKIPTSAGSSLEAIFMAATGEDRVPPFPNGDAPPSAGRDPASTQGGDWSDRGDRGGP